ncbi:MAG: hypothetical protein VKO39_13690 [Cyanobacteriota bacterium]|nr:hypothetical protein [Cyanobacteriota bacterium]
MKSGAETSYTPHNTMNEQITKVVNAFKKMRNNAEDSQWEDYCDNPDMDELLTELGNLEDVQAEQIANPEIPRGRVVDIHGRTVGYIDP